MLKNFRIRLVIRIITLAIFIWSFTFLLWQTELYASMVIVAAIILYQVYMLINYVDKTNDNLQRFFDAVKYSDFSQNFSNSGLGASFDGLKAQFAEVMEAFRKTRTEKEENFRYLQTLVQHVGIGLIAFQPDGSVDLINHQVKKLLKVNSLTNLHSLPEKYTEFVEILLKLKSRSKKLIKIYDEDEIFHLSVFCTELILTGKAIKIVSLQNIQSELEENEMEAWQKLIRVLTHEIMNSITPISSLASTVNGLLEKEDVKWDKIDLDVEDIQTAVKTIKRRSEGLLNFVESYRSLTKIPQPNFQIISIKTLFQRIYTLLEQDIKNSMSLRIDVSPESLEVTADPDLLEQVLINLLKNAIHAINKKGEIELLARLDARCRVNIIVHDNGQGILPDIQEKIFIPFFTTKKEGSGIGLSLCRQIMRMHYGTITLKSEPEKGSTFILRFL